MQKFNLLVFLCFILAALTGCGESRSVLVEETENAAISDTETQDKASEEQALDQTNELIAVYVCGAVVAPGVYYLEADSIKQDALNMAGGFAAGAASNYVNLAQTAVDGEQIYFPYESELADGSIPEGQSNGDTSEQNGKLNINEASNEELMTLPGIGENKAKDIISYRENNGLFQTIEDIKNVPGIKDGVYNKIKDYITVG